jgi:spore germination cell wall hydrolase CwlJ-like protein
MACASCTEYEKVSQAASNQVAKIVDQKQLHCLATNIYYEAAGEPEEGKAAVARVVVNRINHGFASTPCKVVYQTANYQQTDEDNETFWSKVCQFSWVCEGKNNPNKNSKAYQSSLRVAYDVLALDKHKEVIPSSVLFFHNTTVKPQLNYGYKKQIGNHIFYSKIKRKHVTSKKSRQGFVQSPRTSGDAEG